LQTRKNLDKLNRNVLKLHNTTKKYKVMASLRENQIILDLSDATKKLERINQLRSEGMLIESGSPLPLGVSDGYEVISAIETAITNKNNKPMVLLAVLVKKAEIEFQVPTTAVEISMVQTGDVIGFNTILNTKRGQYDSKIMIDVKDNAAQPTFKSLDEFLASLKDEKTKAMVKSKSAKGVELTELVEMYGE
jgi:hypothetical protein